MPTLQPPVQRGIDPLPHRSRMVAESFGADADRYDRTRPGYPQEMVERILTTSPGPDLVDVGIGTGIAARQFEEAGATVLGVEVDYRMAAVARRRGFAVEVTRFESWDPVGRTFDAVVAGQTWHWVEPAAGAAKAAQVLRPAGRVALFWNVFQPTSDVADAFAEAYRRVQMPINPWVHSGLSGYATILSGTATGIREVGAFGEPDQWRFDWERSYTRDEWLDQIPTHGGHNLLPTAQLQELLRAVGTVIDTLGGSFTMGYAAVAVTAVRLGAP